MASHSSLNTLIEWTQNNADQAAKQLRRLNDSRRDAEQQLLTLQGYRQDYAARLENAAGKGVSASNYRNFGQFLATLDEAITQQNRILIQIDANLESGRRDWHNEKRKLNSYATLLSRQDRQHVLLENRKEQRDSDEISARQLRRSEKIH